MPHIIVTRNSEPLYRFQEIELFIDGEKMGLIANGESKSFPVLPGRHTIFSKIDWNCSSAYSFQIEEQESKHFKLAEIGKSYRWMPFAMGVILLHFVLKELPSSNYFSIFSLPLFILLVIYLGIARKEYLSFTPSPEETSIPAQ
jgi:hypothetical protein